MMSFAKRISMKAFSSRIMRSPFLERRSRMEIGTFGCDRATVSAIFATQGSGVSDKMPVQDLESGSALTGYAGNALNFRFENRPKLEKSKKN
jgi:hypothetical protein